MKASISSIPPRSFLHSDCEFFLYSGEIHYFRLPPERWHKVLKKAKQAKLSAICTYIPWNWHEPEPGQFDFTGASHPRRNLLLFLELCGEMGFKVHFRPGPTIVSEWRHGGFPDWLLRGQPEILALNSKAEPPNLDSLYPPVTYLHPVFLEHAASWYRSFLPILKDHMEIILAIQIDNELMYGWGLRCGDPLFIDYNPFVIGSNGSPGFYQRWLSEKYGEIERLNEIYRTQMQTFDQIQPPYRAMETWQDIPWFLDWHYCKECMANQYVEFLYDLLVSAGVDTPLTMLSPYLTPYGVRRFTDYFQQKGKEILVTTQCYPTLFGTGGFSQENAGHVAALMQLSRDWIVGTPYPFISNETQSAMSYYLPAKAMEAFYTLQVGQGLTGLNFYMMAGGDNPPGYGMNLGGSYDISAPIGMEGEERPHFPVIRRLGEFLQTYKDHILETKPLLDLAVGYYPPYETAALQGNTIIIGSRQRYDEILSQVFGLGTGAIARGSGVFSLLTAAGYTYAMLDLERTPLSRLLEYPQLWCLGLDFMFTAVQDKLASYVISGGHLVMLPQVPSLDENMRPCSILQQIFPAQIIQPQVSVPQGSRRLPWHLVRIGDIGGIPVNDTLDSFDLSSCGAEACAWDERSDQVCGYTITHGEGKATLLGFKPRYGWNNQGTFRQLIKTICEWGKVRKHSYAESAELLTIERTGNGSGFLFVINATSWPQSSRIYYQDPHNGDGAVLPRLIKNLTLPDQGGLILPLRIPLAGQEFEVVYATSQLQSWSKIENEFELCLFCPGAMEGEIALRMPAQARVYLEEAELLSEVREADLNIFSYQPSNDLMKLRILL